MIIFDHFLAAGSGQLRPTLGKSVYAALFPMGRI